MSKISDKYRHARDGVLKVQHEEEFTAGVWVKPSILGPPSIEAILTFNNGTWPGDIWLIDELGEIAVIEVRRDSSKRRPRPLETFKQYVEVGCPETDEIERKWGTRTLEEGKVLDSNESKWRRQWPALDARVMKGLKSRRYEQSIRRCFKTRPRNENGVERSPMPCLAGLRLVTSRPGRQLKQRLMDDWGDLAALGLPKGKGRIYVGGILKRGTNAHFAAQDVTEFGPFEDDGWERLRTSSDSVIKFLLGEK